MTEQIKYDRTSDTSRTIWAAAWAVEKIAKEIVDLSAKDLTEGDFQDLAYFTHILMKRVVVLNDAVLVE